METVSFRDSEARGRNGWFRVASASLYTASGRVNVDVVSKRAVCPGPVFLELSPEDATALAHAILSQAHAVLHPPAPVRLAGRRKGICQQSVRRSGVNHIPGRSP
jgi:hypothetical protein